MIDVRLALGHAERRLVERLQQLSQRIDEADEAAWSAYCEAAAALAAIAPQVAPGANGELLTTAQMAARLNVSTKKLLRMKKAKKITPAVQLGERGRTALRWTV